MKLTSSLSKIQSFIKKSKSVLTVFSPEDEESLEAVKNNNNHVNKADKAEKHYQHRDRDRNQNVNQNRYSLEKERCTSSSSKIQKQMAVPLVSSSAPVTRRYLQLVDKKREQQQQQQNKKHGKISEIQHNEFSSNEDLPSFSTSKTKQSKTQFSTHNSSVTCNSKTKTKTKNTSPIPSPTENTFQTSLAIIQNSRRNSSVNLNLETFTSSNVANSINLGHFHDRSKIPSTPCTAPVQRKIQNSKLNNSNGNSKSNNNNNKNFNYLFAKNDFKLDPLVKTNQTQNLLGKYNKLSELPNQKIHVEQENTGWFWIEVCVFFFF